MRRRRGPILRLHAVEVEPDDGPIGEPDAPDRHGDGALLWFELGAGVVLAPTRDPPPGGLAPRALAARPGGDTVVRAGLDGEAP